MQDEMKSLYENNTFELVKLPKGKKKSFEEQVDIQSERRKKYFTPRCKDSLVVYGFTPKKDIDFDEIFSLIVKMPSIRLVLGLTASLVLQVEQMDVKTTFLYGDLDKKIYMEQLDGFRVKGKENYVCKLNKSLYGLKQTPSQWYKKFELVRVEQGQQKVTSDHFGFVHRFFDDDFVILLLYVDDMLIVCLNASRLIS